MPRKSSTIRTALKQPPPWQVKSPAENSKPDEPLSKRAIEKTIDNYDEEIWRYFPHSFAEVASDGKWIPYDYLVTISKAIAKAVYAGGGRLIIELPPRHGKSELISKWVPTWYLDMFPENRVLLASYEADFAAHWGRQVRAFFEQAGELSKTKVDASTAAADRWGTTYGGSMNTAGIGGAFTGKGGDLMVIDDPVKNWEQAMSEGYRQKAIDWYRSTFSTRAEPGATIIILMTRWHEDDLAGTLLKENPGVWQEIKMPAINAAGEALCPARYPVESLKAIKVELGSYMYGALYDQNPTPPEGGIFKRHWFKYYTQTTLPSHFDEVIQSWDLPFDKTENSSFASGQVWGRKGADRYLLAEVHKQLDFPEMQTEIRKLSDDWPEARTKVVENKAAGAPIIASLKREIAGLIAWEPRGSKEARAISVSGEVESGNVFLPIPAEAPWVRDYIEEVCTFPKAKLKDRVDSMVQALLRFSKNKPLNTLNFGSLTRPSAVGGI